jgi:hypothetical protein
MKLPPRCLISHACIAALSVAAINFSHNHVQAQTQNNIDTSQVQWICKESYEQEKNQYLPTTFAWTSRGKIAIVRWATNYFKGAGFDPQTRCQQVSQHLQKAYKNGSLKMITNGWMNGQPVICTTTQVNGDCVDLVMTLRREDNSLAIVQQFNDIFNGRKVGPIKHSGGQPQIYYQINIAHFLATAPLATE